MINPFGEEPPEDPDGEVTGSEEAAEGIVIDGDEVVRESDSSRAGRFVAIALGILIITFAISIRSRRNRQGA